MYACSSVHEFYRSGILNFKRYINCKVFFKEFYIVCLKIGNVNNILADTVGRMLKTFSETYQYHQKTADV